MKKQHRYLPLTEQDRSEMLKVIGVESADDLFQDIPEELRLTELLELPEALSEHDLVRHMKQLADEDTTASTMPYFLGAGVYDHFIPSVVNHIMLRSEFLTAYVPYQPEASQGELQAIFEFQSMVCELTGMHVANSSLYDAFTSLGEACNLAVGATKKRKVYASKGIHEQARNVLDTYAYAYEYDVLDIPLVQDVTDVSILKEQIDMDTAAVVVQYPNFLGSIEDLRAIKDVMVNTKALLIVVANPLALAVLESPGSLGADIVVGDMQPMGLPMSYGGPHAGYFASTEKYMRKLPSRIVGQTVDADGKRGYVMTLQTREQHIRREKATSNMSSNQALYALGSAVFMTALGKQGVQEMAQQNIAHSHYMQRQCLEKGLTVYNENAFFNEFVVILDRPIDDINDALLERGFVGGYDVSHIVDKQYAMLVCATEKRTKDEIDQFVQALVEVNRA